MNIKEFRIGNLVKTDFYDFFEIRNICSLTGDVYNEEIGEVQIHSLQYIPIIPENIEKYIDWEFQMGFNKEVVENEYWITTRYIMENSIDGTGTFEIQFSISKSRDDFMITYLIDNEKLEFGLDDTLHNVQNLFFTATSQELPIKKNKQ